MKTLLILLAITTTALLGCKKQNDWLEVKSDKSDVVPKTLKDMQALLDNEMLMNAGHPALGLVASDNYYVTNATWQSQSVLQRNAYIYNAEIFEGAASNDWNTPYRQVAQANIVLAGLQKIEAAVNEAELYNTIKGHALFSRAVAFYGLAQSFAKPYTAATATTDPGIPLKLTADVNVVMPRSTVAATYEQVVADLLAAKQLLPVTAQYQTRPSKVAADAMLARVFISMEDYTKALQHATEALAAYSFLLDYNTVSPTAANAFAAYPNNKEVTWYHTNINYGIANNAFALLDTTFYRSYDVNDLRRTVFYKANGPATILFKGAYTGQNIHFAGTATNELFLISAECKARAGNTATAMADLNTLLQKRWKSGTFVPLTASSSAEALLKILEHRRKELPFTAQLRWEDLRRLNKDPQFAKTLVKVINGTTYTLPPGDNRWVYPIPDNEIRLSGIVQNLR